MRNDLNYLLLQCVSGVKSSKFDFAAYGEEILRLIRMTAFLPTMHGNSGPLKFNVAISNLVNKG